MSNRVNADGKSDRAASSDAPVPMDGTETVECYTVDEETVIYDAENPLAWIETDTTVDIEDAI